MIVFYIGARKTTGNEMKNVFISALAPSDVKLLDSNFRGFVGYARYSAVKMYFNA